MSFTNEQTLNFLLYEAISADGMHVGADISEIEEFKLNLPIIKAIIDDDREKLGDLIMDYARRYLMSQLTESDAYHDLDLCEFLYKHGVDVGDE